MRAERPHRERSAKIDEVDSDILLSTGFDVEVLGAYGSVEYTHLHDFFHT